MELSSPLFAGGFFAVMVLLGATLQDSKQLRDSKIKWMYAAFLAILILGAGGAAFTMRLNEELANLGGIERKFSPPTTFASDQEFRVLHPIASYYDTESDAWRMVDEMAKERDRIASEADQARRERDRIQSESQAEANRLRAEIESITIRLTNYRNLHQSEVNGLKQRLTWYRERLGSLSSTVSCRPSATYMATGFCDTSRPLVPIVR